MWENFSTAALKRAAREDQIDTFVWTKKKEGEETEVGGGLMSALTTEAPRDKRRSMVARPIPDEPPRMRGLT